MDADVLPRDRDDFILGVSPEAAALRPWPGTQASQRRAEGAAPTCAPSLERQAVPGAPQEGGGSGGCRPRGQA